MGTLPGRNVIRMAIATICASLQSSSSNDTVMSAIEAELRTQGWDPRRVAGLERIPPFRPDIDPPNEVTAWAGQLDAAEGVAIATPEYAAGPPGALKNALDWLVGLSTIYRKPVVVVCAGTTGGAFTTVVARHVVLAGGAINSPALLMRSKAPDPHQRLGSRTFLHPVAITTAVMAEPVQAWTGAPQSIYSDHFMHTQPVDGPIAFKLEVAPLHPVFFGANLPGFGESQAALFRQYPNAHVTLALMRDGFHPQSVGGKVELRSDGSPLLDYPLTDYVLEGARRAMLAMAQIQFEAGARMVYPGHELARGTSTWAETKAAIEDRQRPRHGRLRPGRRREGRRHPS